MEISISELVSWYKNEYCLLSDGRPVNNDIEQTISKKAKENSLEILKNDVFTEYVEEPVKETSSKWPSLP